MQLRIFVLDDDYIVDRLEFAMLTKNQLKLVIQDAKNEFGENGEALHKGYDEVLAEMFLNITHHISEFAGKNTLYVSFDINKKAWDEYRKHGLGQLYGIDLSNYLYRKGILNEYSVPSIDDRKRAKNGLKHINVTYYLRGTR